MDKINVGFIGCGVISNLHAPGYKNNKRANLYAVCDANPEVAEARKKEWKAKKAYTDYRELLDDPEVDAVEIITPHKLHERMVIGALDAGKHVAVQKPMTISLKSADRMIRRANSSDKIFKVTDNYLTYPPIALAKKMIEAGDIGDPQIIRMKMVNSAYGGWDLPTSAYDWRFEEYSEGRFSETYDHGHHEWATAWFLMGEVERVTAWIDSIDGIMDSPVTLMWKHKGNKRYGICDFAFAEELYIPSKYYANDEWFEITGSKGIIFIHRCTGDVHTGPAVSLFTSKGWRHFDKVKSDWLEGFKGAVENFISAVKGEEPPLLTGEQGKEILRISFAIYESAKRRRDVYTDELEKAFPTLYAKRRTRKEKKESYIASFKPPLFGKDYSKYAPQAKKLTEDFMGRFDPAAAQDWKGIVGVVLKAEGGVSEQRLAIKVEGGKARLIEGKIPEDAGITLTIPAGSWAAILMGKKRIETALFKGELKIDGEVMEGMKLRSAFHI
ncbi:MAG: Gfo/Idh/MocA family oxidoreductase [Deltaproteobacteria bacterium]|uniref:Gfo/Idh/MocA family oxidoreductase n=1 Tax=Candidatus Zymogenus saltonus TaxID=2844893 RepID=A0A9D8KG25_9DELT|nr:Gfo/Idh/MocA family oxidoreductase [Candidatus Zymogenus saltonus]